jgi:hypothetical protein
MAITNVAVAWAIGIIWPDQSFASLRKYRGPLRIVDVPYHVGRIEMLEGDYNQTNLFPLLIILSCSKINRAVISSVCCFAGFIYCSGLDLIKKNYIAVYSFIIGKINSM